MANVLILKAADSSQGNTEPDHASDPYVQSLLNLDGVSRVEIASVLQFEFVNIHQLAEQLNRPERFCGLVLTSIRCVEAVALAFRQPCCDDGKAKDVWAQGMPCYVVGQRTAKACGSLLDWKPDLVLGQETGNAQALIHLILGRTRPSSLLVPCGNLAKDDWVSKLTSEGIQISRVICYQTSTCPQLQTRIHKILSQHFSGQLDIIAFFSPSGVTFAWPHLNEAIPNLAHAVTFVAIGPTTADSLIKMGCQSVFTAAKPCVDDLTAIVKAVVANSPS